MVSRKSNLDTIFSFGGNMRQGKRFGLVLPAREREMACKLTETEGEPVAVVLRRLIREAAKQRGL